VNLTAFEISFEQLEDASLVDLDHDRAVGRKEIATPFASAPDALLRPTA